MPAIAWSYRRRYHAHTPFLPLMALGPLPLIGLAAAGVVGISLAFAVVVTVLAMLLSAVVAVGVLGTLGFGAYQLARHTMPLLAGPGRRTSRRAVDGAGTQSSRKRFTVETPVDALRRRYAAGEIGQTQFRRALVELVKERYVRGDLTLDEYESRVRHIYLDPALRPPAGSL